jgi:hypothetical protein
VQRDRKCAGGALYISVMRKYWVLPAHRDRLADQRLLPAYVRQAVDVPGERLREFTSVTSLAPDVLVNIQIFLAGPGRAHE